MTKQFSTFSEKNNKGFLCLPGQLCDKKLGSECFAAAAPRTAAQ